MEEKDRACNIDMHNNVLERLDRNEKRLNSHSERIDKLERNDGVLATKIDNLTEKIKFQTQAIWGLVASILMLAINKIFGGGL